MKRLITLTGPSCSGKSTLEAMLAERGCAKAVSTTTRAPRAGEIDGEHYYFVSHDKFRAMVECDMFVEAVRFGEHHYGLSTAEVERLFMDGKTVVVVCEPVGAAQIRKFCAKRPDIELCAVFVDAPADLIAERYMRRYAQDLLEAGADASRLDKVASDYAKRLTIMMTTEQGWRLNAWNRTRTGSDDPYHWLIERFDAANDSLVADRLAFGR